jgi:hypothetical protein
VFLGEKGLGFFSHRAGDSVQRYTENLDYPLSCFLVGIRAHGGPKRADDSTEDDFTTNRQ